MSIILKFFFLKYSWFTILWPFLLYSRVTPSYVYIYIYTHSLFLILSSIMVYPKRLAIVPCAIQQDVTAYPFQMWQFASTKPQTLRPSHSLRHPPWQPQVCSLCLWGWFCFVESLQVHWCHILVASLSLKDVLASLFLDRQWATMRAGILFQYWKGWLVYMTSALFELKIQNLSPK